MHCITVFPGWESHRLLQPTMDVNGEASHGAEMSPSLRSITHSQGCSSLQRNSAFLLVEMTLWCFGLVYSPVNNSLCKLAGAAMALVPPTPSP